MDENEFKKWLENSVSDMFMDLFYYDRKECEQMSLANLKTFEKLGVLNKELLIEVFTKQINSEFSEESEVENG